MLHGAKYTYKINCQLRYGEPSDGFMVSHFKCFIFEVFQFFTSVCNF